MAATLSRRVDMAEEWPDAVKVEEYKGYTIAIVPDSSPSPVRGPMWKDGPDNENLGTLITWHRGYASPDGKRSDLRCSDDWRDFLTERKRERHSADPGLIWLWVDYGYSGELRADASADESTDLNFDGVIFVTYADARKAWGNKPIAAIRDDITERLKGEVKVYSLWATGQVYGFVVGDAEDENIDSCWGFISFDPDGDDYALEQGKEAVDGLIADGRLPVIAEQDDAEDIDEY